MPAGGRRLVTKRRYMRLVGLGLWGRGGGNMRRVVGEGGCEHIAAEQ